MSAAQTDLLSWRPRRPGRAGWRAFDVLTWNVLAPVHVRRDWYPAVPPEALDATLRLPRVAGELARRHARRPLDVVALQEVAPALVPLLRSALPDHHLVHAPYAGEGMAVLVRGEPEGAEVIALPGGAKRAILVTLPGGWRLASVHLSWTGPPGEAPARRRGLEQLRAVLSAEPHVVVGDFNAFPGWPERREARRAGLRDLSPRGPTCLVRRWPQPLDAVLAAPGWRGRAHPLPPLPADAALPSAALPSDHLPVRVSLACP